MALTKIQNLFSRGKQSPWITGSQLPNPFRYKKRFVLVGTMGAGKSSFMAGLYLMAMKFTNQYPDFLCNIVEGSSNILDDVSRLRRGHYPEKTKITPFPIEPGLVLTWTSWPNREKHVQIPTADAPGELYSYIIRRDKGLRPDPTQVMADQALLSHLEQADALIPVIAASRALMFKDDLRLEDVPDAAGDTTISADDDVNLARIINSFVLRKQSQHKSVDAVGLVVHKIDLIKPYLDKIGLDIYDPSGQGFRKFMNVCYPTTMMSLKRLMRQDKVRIFPTFIQQLYDTEGNPVTWKDGSPRVATTKDVNPDSFERDCLCSQQAYFEFFQWAKSFAS